jgi:hypothetical protein
LVLNLRGGGYALAIRFNDKVEIIPIDSENDTIGHIKIECYKRFGIPTREQTLTINGEVLDKNAKAITYQGKRLELKDSGPKKPQALALGAGGRIRQRIEPDPTKNPRIWDVASSKILNIQLLDARSFQAVTGLPPPETPVTAEAYAKLGLPFYQLKGSDGKGGEGPAGDWDGLVGVAEAVGHKMGVEEDGCMWGLQKSGAWGRVGKTDGEGGAPVGERNFENPLVLLDMDGTVPEFKSVAKEKEEEGPSRRRTKRMKFDLSD